MLHFLFLFSSPCWTGSFLAAFHCGFLPKSIPDPVMARHRRATSSSATNQLECGCILTHRCLNCTRSYTPQQTQMPAARSGSIRCEIPEIGVYLLHWGYVCMFMPVHLRVLFGTVNSLSVCSILQVLKVLHAFYGPVYPNTCSKKFLFNVSSSGTQIILYSM